MVSTTSAERAGASRGLVVLCCADENLLELAPVVEGLGKLALRVELVSGVDLDSTLVNAAAAKYTDASLWVLCQSEALDAFQVGRLESNLGESGVPSTSVLTTEVDSNTAEYLVSTISQAAPGHADAAAHRSDASSSYTRPAGAPTGPSPTIGALLGDDLPPAMPDQELAPPPRNMMPIYAGAGAAGLLAIIVTAVLVTRAGGDPEDAEAPVAAAVGVDEQADEDVEALPPTPVADTDGAVNIDGAEPETDPMADTDGEAAADTDGAEQVIDEAALAEMDAAAADAVIDEALAETGEDGDGDSDALPSTTSPEEQALIDAAIRERQIRSLDILLVHPQRSRRKSYGKARAWCEEKEVAGIGNWRLPTIGEVRTISEARLVPRDYYWTHTAADTFGDQLLVWNGKRKRIVPKTGRWSGGRALCVRTRDGAPAISEDVSKPDEKDGD